MADPVVAAARHGVAAGLLGAGGHGKGPLDPPRPARVGYKA